MRLGDSMRKPSGKLNAISELPESFQKYFWDVDWNDLNRHRKQYTSFIVSRLADKGDLEVISWLKSYFDVTEIAACVMQSRSVSRKTRLFWERYGSHVQTHHT